MTSQLKEDGILIERFNGLYLRRNATDIPDGYQKELINFTLGDGSVQHRNQFIAYVTTTTLGGDIYRAYATDPNDNTRFLFAVHVGLNTLIYDTFQAAAILTYGVLLSDFNFLKIRTRQFIAMHSSGVGGSYYVFDSTVHTAARLACGAGPTSTLTVTVAGGAGTKNISVGRHVWGVVYETDTGHITVLPLTALTSAVHAGQMADLSVIPTGPAGTAKRHIVVSKVIPNFDSNLLNYEVFFLPNGTLNDNTTTVLANVEFYDSELLDSADYLKDLYGTAPNTAGACTFGNRVVLWSGDSHTLTISEPGKPESFNTVSGLCEVDPGYGKGIQNCVEQNGSLVVFKDIGTYILTDNGDEPNTWIPAKVEGSLGTHIHGLALGYGANVVEIQKRLLVMTEGGLYEFNGGFSSIPLTLNIGGYIADHADVAKTWQLAVDPKGKFIYLGSGTAGSSTMDTILVGDYKEGLTPDTIKWSKFIEYSGSSAATFASLGVLNTFSATAEAPNIGGSLFIANIGNGVTNATKAVFRLHTDSAVPRTFLWALETGELNHNLLLDDDQNVFLKFLYNLYSGITQPTNGTNVVLTAGNNAAVTITVSGSTGEQFKEQNVNNKMRRPTIRLEILSGTATPAYFAYIKKLILYGLPISSKRPQ